ncbi:superoxide dismutase [Candidatus Kaiserbacteria bacterium]|nr:superoxide dismutase [Candidatus Kaiserbacteria bacterium]
MHTYEAKRFDLPKLDGISDESVKQHLGLYEGYVKNFNAISKLLAKLATEDSEKYAHAIAELMRRRSFEFDGMRLHEYYFSQFEGGSIPLTTEGALAKALESTYRPYTAEKVMTMIGNMRGPGWAILYYDPNASELLTGFTGEQHQGHFVTLPIILALDVWEHAFILDYGALGKGKYIDAFFKNLNWGVIEKRFEEIA